MKTSHLILIQFFSLCLLTHVLSSNPDSELVQDSTEGNTDGSKSGTVKSTDSPEHKESTPIENSDSPEHKDYWQKISAPIQSADTSEQKDDGQKKFAAMRDAESKTRSLVDLDSYPLPRVRVMRPIRTDNGIVWREVGVYQSSNILNDRSSLYEILREFRNNGPDSVVPADDKVPQNVGRQAPASGNIPLRPSNDNRGFNENGPSVSQGGSGRNYPYVPSNNGGTSFTGRRASGQGVGNSNAVRPNNGGTSYSGRGAGSQGEENSNVAPGVQNPSSFQPNNGGSSYSGRGSAGQGVGYNNVASGAQNPSSFQPNNGGTSYSGGGTGSQGVGYSNVASGAQNPSSFQPNNGGTSYSGNGQNKGVSVNTPVNRDRNYGNYGPPVRQNTRLPTIPNRKISPDAKFFAAMVNDFAFKLVERMNVETNFVVAPLSIFVALCMCYLGSDGNTETQMAQALGLNLNNVHRDHLHQGMRDLIAEVAKNSTLYRLFVANGMFLGKNFTVSDQFQEDIKKYYTAELKNIDFTDPNLSVAVINEWVARSTRNMIPNLIDRPPPLLTRLILMNAVYFKGTWKTQFPLDLTHNGRFHAADGSEKKAPTMSVLRQTFPVYRSDERRHSFIKLPYTGDQISMIIALPYTENDRPMPGVRDQILCYVRDAMQDTYLDKVSIPKFKLEDDHSLRRPVMQLGITDLFNVRSVDLRKLRRQNDVYVSAILQKAVVEVNEEGTTAAATTGVKFVGLSLQNTTDFLVDHPFAFYIIHEPTGLVLFYGTVYDLGVKAETPQRNGPMGSRPYS